MTDAPLFDVPEAWWRRRRCTVCGGPLSVTATHTYVVRRQGWVKVGASSNVAERLGVLRRGTPGCLVRMPDGMDVTEPLELLAVLDGPLEHEIHAHLAASHAAGEWFHLDGLVAAWLADQAPPSPL